MITAEQVINEIKSDSRLCEMYLDFNEFPLPGPYIPADKTKIKAFVLGTDPSNFSDDKKTVKIATVFDIGKDKRYFDNINSNLQMIGLSLENVYVQNMVRNYMKEETRSNPEWNYFAVKWFGYINEEFDNADPAKQLPVFITAEKLLKFLLNNPFDIGLPKEYYSGTIDIPILPEDNKLERNLIPLYRHPEYRLEKQEYYKNKIIDFLSTAMD
jgi:hypothetical protein